MVVNVPHAHQISMLEATAQPKPLWHWLMCVDTPCKCLIFTLCGREDVVMLDGLQQQQPGSNEAAPRSQASSPGKSCFDMGTGLASSVCAVPAVMQQQNATYP